jgi:L-fucono-1,5-lactonase
VIVDAHHHFWDPTRADYPWMTGSYEPVRRPFGPGDLAPLLTANRVDATVLVQARMALDETDELLAIAANTPFVRGVVGWVDLTDPGVSDLLAELRARPGGGRLVGIRHQVHDEPDPEWLLRDDVRRGIRAVGEAGLAYDLLVRTRKLPAALAVAEALPDVRFVIDHIAKPPIRDGVRQPWADRMAAFAALEHVACKLSGMVTEADWEEWQPADLAPYVDHVLAVFGPRRVLFGSDWPVCLLAASYDRVVETDRELLGGLSEAESAAVFGDTATEVYRLA